MTEKTGVIYVRVGIKDGYNKLIPSEVDDLDFSFKHKFISHSESLAFALNPEYVEYALYLEMDLDKEDVDDVVSNMVVENESYVRDGRNIFKVIKYSADYESIFD
jgi:hypothetical protein